MERTFTTNSRLVSDIFANYISTFAALWKVTQGQVLVTK